MRGQTRVLLVSGSTRSRSGNTAALATAAAVAPGQVTALLYEGLAELPAFNPDHDGERLPDAGRAPRTPWRLCLGIWGRSSSSRPAAAFRWTARRSDGPRGDRTRGDGDRSRFHADIAQVWEALLSHLGQR